MIVALLWLGCPRPPVTAETAAQRPPQTEQRREPIEGPMRWSEPGGLYLEIPEGWSGSSGSAPLLLDLTQSSSGFRLTIRSWSVGADPLPLEGYYQVFEDDGRYRTVPLFGADAASRTFIAEDPDGATVQSWHAPVGERVIEVAAHCPIGRLTEGRAVIDALAREIRTEQLLSR